MGKGKKMKKRDPLAPKMPSSSYMEFAKMERPKVLLDLGQLAMVDVGREMGKRWKLLTPEQKAPFEQKSKENRVRYEQDMEVYRSKEQATEKPTTSLIEVVGDNTTALPNSTPNISLPTTATFADPAPTTLPSKFEAADLGFAKQKGYSWHPALRTGELARGSRIHVTYFGSGQTGTVDRAKWLKFSKEAEEKITTPRMRKYAAFNSGLDQLKNLLAKIQIPGEVASSSGIPFTAQSGDRRLRKLSKDGLQKEEEENSRLMREKIVKRDDSPNKWGCRDCAWKGKYSHKAKAHARACGLRRRDHIRKPKENKHECSGAECTLSFPYLSQLYDHYR